MSRFEGKMGNQYTEEAERAAKYANDLEHIQDDFDYELLVHSNLLPDLPYTEHFMCGDDVITRWHVDHKPVHIAGAKAPADLALTATIDGDDIVIEPPIPEGVVIRVAYQFAEGE